MNQKDALDKAGALIAEALQLIVNSNTVTVAAVVTGKATVPAEAPDEDEDPKPKKSRRPEPEDEEEVKPRKGLKLAKAAPEPDEDEPAADEEALDALADLDLESASRGDMKEVALKLGLDAEGKRAPELREMLTEAKAKASKPAAKKSAKPAPEPDDDDADVPASKKSKAKAKSDDRPSTKQMKKDFTLFCEANREELEPTGFFGGKVKRGATKADHTFEEILEDDDLLIEAWDDNIKEYYDDGTWEKLAEELQEQLDAE